MIEKVLNIKQRDSGMIRANIDIGQDKGLDVPNVADTTIEIVDKGHDKGQSVLYNTIAVVGNEEVDDKGQSEQYGIRNDNKDAVVSKENADQLTDKD